jgi:hypothetical protein
MRATLFARRETVMLEKDAMWFASPDVRATYSEDGAVLLDINKGLCYSLNPVAARIWVTIETSPGGVTLNGIVGVLETHVQIPRPQLEKETTDYLEKLREIGLAHQNGHAAAKATGGKR